MKAYSTSLWLLALLFLTCQVKCGVGFKGYWGGWGQNSYGSFKDEFAFCGAAMRFEQPQGTGDDTAANGVHIISCSRYNWNEQQEDVFTGRWGDWLDVKMCPYGQWVTSFRVRAEAPLGSGGDDTALNGLQLYCQDIALQHQTYVMVYEGLWGDWSEWYSVSQQQSNRRYFFNQASFRSEAFQVFGGDDTALNGIWMEQVGWDI